MLDPRRLRVLRQVAESGSIVGAARALSFTPSAVSQQIAALEREVGVRLLDRGRRGVALTDAGSALVARADVILRELARAEADVRAVLDLAAGTIRIGAFPSAGTELVPNALLAFAAGHPGVDVRLFELEPEESLPRLRTGELDLVVAYECDYVPLGLGEELVQETLFREPMFVVVGKGRSRTRGPIDLRELADERWIASTPGTSIRDFTIRACQAAGFEPRLASHWNDFQVVQSLTAAGLGVAFIPRLAVRPTRPGVVVRTVQGEPGRRVFAAWLPGGARARLVATALDALRGAAQPLASPARQRG